jgi:chorismate-pyruvate lyase
MEVAMRKVILIVTAALAVTALSLVAAMPLVAAWRMSAEQHATDLPIQQIQGLSLVY